MCDQGLLICYINHDNLTAKIKHCFFRCSRSPDVDGNKLFDKDDQVAIQ